MPDPADLAITHPDNRHGERLRPIYVRDLLALFVAKWWLWSETPLALAGGIPPNAEGQRWQSATKVLIE